MKNKKLLTLTLSFTLLTGCTVQNNLTSRQISRHKEENMTTVDFTLSDLNGNTHRLSDYRGKKVYLKFWASWCSICLAGLEDLNDLAAEQTEDIMILSAASPGRNGEQSEEDFKKWFPKLGYDHLTVLLDNGGALLEEYGIRLYPSSVFFDSEGHPAQTRVGHLSNEEILNILGELN